MKFHESLAAHRERAGYTRDQVARRIGVTGHAYRRWERGETKPNIDQVMASAKALGISVNDLCYGPQPDNVQTIEVTVAANEQVNVVIRSSDSDDAEPSAVRISTKK